MTPNIMKAFFLFLLPMMLFLIFLKKTMDVITIINVITQEDLYTVEPPIMDPPTRATRGQTLMRDTLHGTICILLVLFKLPPKDSLFIKDSVSAPKVSFIQRLYCTSLVGGTKPRSLC